MCTKKGRLKIETSEVKTNNPTFQLNLLIITQKVDKEAPILGFFCRWVEEFAKHCNRLTVICLKEGEHDFPGNVSVYSLGKEKIETPSFAQGYGKARQNSKFKIPRRIKYTIRFCKLIWRKRRGYDAVFVHMNPIYVILGGLFWRLWGKTTALWYTHKTVDLKLRVAEKLAHILFSASETSFRMQSRKVQYVGHGIDTDLFAPDLSNHKHDVFDILTVGRISPVKDYETLLQAAENLKENTSFDFTLTIVGGPATKRDRAYLDKLKKKIEDKSLTDLVSWVGKVPQEKVVDFYQQADAFVNMSKTGSLDKVVLEAMATETYPLTSNEAFQGVFSGSAEKYMFPGGDANLLADKLQEAADTKNDLTELREIVTERHSVKALIPRLLNHIKQACK